MSLNPYYKLESGKWWLHWTKDPDAVLYDILLPNGTHVQAAKTATSAKLGATKPTSAPKVAVAKYGAYETAVDASAPPPPPPPPTSGPVPRAGISVGSHSLFRSDADHKFELDQIQAVGAKILRVDCKPEWFSQVDRMISSCFARGIEPLLILGGQLGGYPGDASWRSTVQNIRDRYATYQGGGIRLYETPNEPNLNGWNVQDLVKASLIAYEEIHKVTGTLLGVGGLAYPADAIWSWASQLIPALDGRYDAFTWHPYNDPQDPSPSNPGDWSAWAVAFGNQNKWATNNIVNVMKANGGVKPFWATECGDTINTRGTGYQASAVSHAITDTRVQSSMVYTMMDDDVPGFGLLDGNRVKRPAWDAFKAAA